MRRKTQSRMVVFDVEGVVVPKIRFILFEVVGRIGAWPFVKGAFLGLLYEMRLISLKCAMKNLYMLFEGLPLERFISLFQRVPIMPRVEYVFKELRRAGFKIALISSSIPRIALEKLGENLGADYVSGLEIGLSEGFLTGHIWGDVIESDGKAVALRRILSDELTSPCYCVAVADDRNNLSMFQLCDLKIGYNPDFILSFRSDHIVKGRLSYIVPLAKGEPSENGSRELSERDLVREFIHIGGFFVSFACAHLVSRYVVAFLIFLITALYTVSETRRMFGKSLPIMTYVTSKAAGESEFQEFVASPIFYALGIIISIVLFPDPICYVCVTVLTLGDGFARVFGEKFGSRRFPFNKAKNLEGTIGGFFLAFSGSLLFVNPIAALVASAAGMCAEVLPLPVDDNLAIPLASGLALTVVSAAFL